MSVFMFISWNFSMFICCQILGTLNRCFRFLFALIAKTSKYFIEVDILHANILHHCCFFINVWSDDTKCRAALPEHACTQHKMRQYFNKSAFPTTKYKNLNDFKEQYSISKCTSLCKSNSEYFTDSFSFVLLCSMQEKESITAPFLLRYSATRAATWT